MSKKNNKKTGDLGEDIACKFLKRSGYKIMARNYAKKFGEIDIVAQKKSVIYFLEVKTSTLNPEFPMKSRPEERVDSRKLHQIGKAVEFYLHEKKLRESIWRFAVIAIIFDPMKKEARIKLIEDIIPE